MRSNILIIVFCFLFLLPAVRTKSETKDRSQNHVTFTGIVKDAATDEVIVGANIVFLNSVAGTMTDNKGRFILRRIKPGDYDIRISHVAYETKFLYSFDLSKESPISVFIQLKKKNVTIKGITVTPGLYSLMGDEPSVTQTLSQEIIEARPQLGDDLFRAVRRLPGVSYNDFSAKFNVRGGEQDEVLIAVDGMELYEPFHLRDVDGGVVSIVNTSVVDRVDFMSGGYPAKFGNRMSGIFNIATRNPKGENKKLTVGLSAINSSFLGEGSFGDGRGSWIISGRRGSLDLVLKVIDQESEVSPIFYDLFSKLQYKLHDRHILVANMLYAKDDFKYRGALVDDADNRGDTVISSYGNSYFWMTLYSSIFTNFTGRTIVSIGSINQNRVGQLYDINQQILEMKSSDSREFDYYGIKTDWEYEVNDNHYLQFGGEYKKMDASYDYFGTIYKFRYVDYGSGPVYQLDAIENREEQLHPSGEIWNSYLSYRFRILKPLSTEIGVRQDYTFYSDENTLSPRVNVSYSFSPTNSLRAGWGYFYQAQRIDEIAIQDKEVDFYPAEKAEHFVLGFEHNFKTGEKLRIQGFYKKYFDLKPSYRNTFGELVSFPELEEDRVRVTFNKKISQGVELYLTKDIGEKFSWWISYVLSKVRDDIKSLYYYNENTLVNYNKEFPFTYDQQHTIYLDLNFRPDKNWQFNVAWQYHTGWPYTDVYITSRLENNRRIHYIQSSEPWSEKLEPFKRLDIRLNRKFRMARGTLTAYVEVINILAETNVRNYEYQLVSNNGVLSINKESESWFHTMPSLGVMYEFNF